MLTQQQISISPSNLCIHLFVVLPSMLSSIFLETSPFMYSTQRTYLDLQSQEKESHEAIRNYRPKQPSRTLTPQSMSFAVVSGASPQSTHGLSPHAPLYSAGCSKTPSSMSRVPAAGLPPPFSLSATNGNDLVDMLGSAPGNAGLHAKRIGTDPAKFKTTICRNWEQTGMCSFRGCTFAHGVDDLRPPMRANNCQQQLASERGVSPVLGPKLSPNTSPSMHASAVHNSGQTSTTKLDTLIEQLVVEVSKDKDLSLVHQEASRTLEAMIRREQSLRQGSNQQLEIQARRLQSLLRKLNDKDRSLSAALQIARSRDVHSSLLSQATHLLDDTSSVVKSAEGCLADSGIQTLVPDPNLSGSQSCTSSPREPDAKVPAQTRSYAAAVTGAKGAPIGLRPIGGSPSDSPNDSSLE